MTIEHLPDFNPPQFGDVDDPSRPILSFAWRADGAHRLAAHSHARAHIIHPDHGAYWVDTAEGTWLVPAGQAIWIAPHLHHQVYSHGAVTARMLFVDAAYTGDLPPRSGAVSVDPLLEQLLERAVRYGNDYATDGPMARLAKVILDELTMLEVAPLLLPAGRDPRLITVMRLLVDDPASAAPIEELAKRAGASPRTLARLFRAETGMTCSQWRMRLRLVESVERLARGATVTEVAMDLGYSSLSSFIHMFRSNLGVSPGNYGLRQAGRAS